MRGLSDISATALVTLQCHAKDAASKNSILGNSKAMYWLDALAGKVGKQAQLKVNRGMVTYIALRAKKYDDVARSFIQRYPWGCIVNIGCGFDNRFERIDNGQLNYYDLDFPEVIQLKKDLYIPFSRNQFLAYSVFDHRWFVRIKERPVLFLAEGVFMYCEEGDVKKLFRDLADYFGEFELFMEVFNSKWLEGWRKKMVDFKLKKQLHFGDEATFRFGIPESKALEKWDNRLTFIEEWSYLDSNHPKIGFLRLFRNWQLFRLMQWSVYYQCNASVLKEN